jgi:hypothetical protein
MPGLRDASAQSQKDGVALGHFRTVPTTAQGVCSSLASGKSATEAHNVGPVIRSTLSTT